MSSFIRSSVKRMRPSARADVHRAVRMMAARATTQKLLNYVYRSLSWQQRAYWHSEYAKLFRGTLTNAAAGSWEVIFAGKSISLPLGGSDMWLNWDAALSVLGHEIEIKRAYAAMINSRHRPALFFDVGANYGLHSLLFLAHGIPTVSFEPNTYCHSYFRRVAEMNVVNTDLRPIALGAEEGSVDLWFPKTETWYGTTVPYARDQIPSDEQIEIQVVWQTTLDRFVEETSLKPDLIKIDTEGAEAGVLYGAAKTLSELRPVIIFESWQDSKREELFKLLDGLDYYILSLRHPRHTPQRLDGINPFLAAPSNNFLAAPSELSSSVLDELRR